MLKQGKKQCFEDDAMSRLENAAYMLLEYRSHGEVYSSSMGHPLVIQACKDCLVRFGALTKYGLGLLY